MNKTFASLIICLLAFIASGQTQFKTALYLNIQGDIPCYNIEYPNNPIGGNIGLTFMLHTRSGFRPKIDLNYHRFIDYHIKYFTQPKGTIIEKGITCLFIGADFWGRKRLTLSFTSGACLYDLKIYPGIRPGLGVFLDREKKFLTEVSLTNLIAIQTLSDSFGFLNLGFRIKLY
jgi:hypothetical protein